MNIPCHPLTTGSSRNRGAFTLVELLISVTILSILILMLTSTVSNVQTVVTRSQSQAEEFKEARQSFELMARRLSQATLNGYWGYVYKDPAAKDLVPLYYDRQSDLHYVQEKVATLVPQAGGNGHAVFFQALLGDSDPASTHGAKIGDLHDLLNCWGFYVSYGSDLTRRPAFMREGHSLELNPERKRYRLMEFRLPPDESILFSKNFNIGAKKNTSELYQWFRGPYKGPDKSVADYSVPLAENILAVVITPYVYVTTADSKGVSTTDMRKKQSYEYDTRLFQWRSGTGQDIISSRHQLPAMLELTVIATDERSYDKLEQRHGVEGAATKVREVFDGLLKLSTDFAPDPNNVQVKEYDVDKIESRLRDLELNYKIFTTTVSLRASKWITEREKQ
ncbi:MAG: Verru_Chthon cassette protein C [Roseimicrobium sp.]